MTLAVFPPELDRPMRQGFERARGDGRLRTTNDAGPTRMRRRVSSMPDKITMTLDLDRDQLARFDRFVEEEIGAGTMPFAMTDPTLDGLLLADADGRILANEDDLRVLIDATWLCVLTEMPTDTPIGVRWRVRFSISVMP